MSNTIGMIKCVLCGMRIYNNGMLSDRAMSNIYNVHVSLVHAEPEIEELEEELEQLKN